MITNYTKQELIDFETDIAECFNNAMIKAPVHLYDGNEEQMIKIFENVKSKDWVFCTWRSHYQCLLKGVPSEQIKKDIIAGKSITLCYPEYNIYSSAIVTGTIPVATGMALDIKRKGGEEHVWCFVGDMASETGSFFENWKYSVNHDLPITYVIENNSKSVCTNTLKTWGVNELFFAKETRKIIYYEYNTKYPHAGAGKRIEF
jgi:TPP-dependent pyruvate/acetoin dehydrogenase alpha subunit|tara:strand:- start:3187 stop:3795 length:609 start_codon:yes stop_codon:yes gene_type:complete